MSRPRLTTGWISWNAAKPYIARHHRHLGRPAGFIVCIGVWDDAGQLRGVATIARPNARKTQERGDTAEITRVATDGCDNACSALYGRCRRVAQTLGFARTRTFTLPTESGASLRGAGFKRLGPGGGGKWGRRNRPRSDKHPTQRKLVWEATA